LSQARNRNNVHFDRARDELFSHIHRCGVLKATAEQQEEWMVDTMEYMSERFPDLSVEELGELRTMGMRFCRPVIDNVQADEEPASDDTEAAAA
jgi:hypothetical protein